MKYLNLIWIIVAVAISFFGCSTNKSLLTSSELAGKYVAKKKNKSLVIAYFKNGKTHFQTFGEYKKGKPADENTVFEIGAATQVFTTSLMLKMHQEGHFDPGDCIKAYLPEALKVPDFQPQKCVNLTFDPAISDDRRTREPIELASCFPDPLAKSECLSFCQLADHSSGVMEVSGHYNWYPFGYFYQKSGFNGMLKSEFFEELQNVEFAFAPGQNYYYSNTGMALLGNVLSNIGGEKYGVLLKQKLLLPLGMDNTGFSGPVSGHNAKGKLVSPWIFDAYKSAGGLQSTAADLLKFMAAQLDNNHELAVVFSEAQLPRKQTVHSKEARMVAAAYGWFISPLAPGGEDLMYWTNGGTAGFRSFLAFNKEAKTAVVVLANSANPIDEIGFKLLNEISRKNGSGVTDK